MCSAMQESHYFSVALTCLSFILTQRGIVQQLQKVRTEIQVSVI